MHTFITLLPFLSFLPVIPIYINPLFILVTLPVFVVVCMIFLIIVHKQKSKYIKIIQNLHPAAGVRDSQNNELLLLKEEAEKREREKAFFYLRLLHQVKTPLTIILNVIYMYLKRREKSPYRISGEAETNTVNVIRNITHLLTIEKVTGGELWTAHTTVINISDALEKALNAFKPLIRKKHVTLTCMIGENIYTKIEPSAFDHIINNLLDNAVKNSRTNGCIDVALAPDDHAIRLVIKDNGPGIPGKIQKTLLRSYYCTREPEKTGGPGFGLYVVKTILDTVHGSIDINSKENAGTTVEVRFKRHTLAGNDNTGSYTPLLPIRNLTETGAVTFLEETYDPGKKTIFITGKDERFLLYLQKNLYKEYNVYYAGNDRPVTDKLSHIPRPAIIIADIETGGMEGHTLCKVIGRHEKYAGIPFIILSSSPDREQIQKILQNGAVDVMIKPFLLEDLIVKCNALLTALDKVKQAEIKKIKAKIKTVIHSKTDNEFLTFEKKCMLYKISPREKDVLRQLFRGLSIKEIAKELYISTHTVRKHSRSIYEKCKVQNRVELLNRFR